MKKLFFFGIFFLTLFSSRPQSCQNNEVILQLSTGDWASEVSWSITSFLGDLIDSTSQTYADSTTYYDTICLLNGCYYFNMLDTYGDGWNGGSFHLTDSINFILANGSLTAGMFSDSISFCVPVPPPTPCNDNILTLQLTTGAWASEVSWSITDSLGGLIDSTSQTYFDSTDYYIDVCVPNGCLNFNMFDAYGDGWQGGGYQLSDLLGNIVSYGNLQGSFSFGTNSFGVNSSCYIEGCTVLSATNYNPSANIDDTSCVFLSDNINLLFNWSNSSLPQNYLGGSYTDVYGVVINGREYAVIGSTMGAHIIDVTNPSQSYEAAFVPGAFQGSAVTHRDYFCMDNYLYAVCDQGTSTLQIIDLSNLPNSVSVVYDSDSLVSTSHNLFIDVQTQKLYSTNGDVLDISNPTNPSFLFHMGFSSHDMWIENDTGYFNCTSNGLQIYEMGTNSPVYIASLTSYPQQGTNHSGWKKDNIYVLADENHGLALKVIDVSNLNNLQVIALFNSGVSLNSIAHNLIIRDNFVYVSYYHDGLQIFDISNPYNPVKAGYYDTYLPNNHNGYAGNWGVDPQLPSGIILASDVQSGLFVLEFDYHEQVICNGDSLLLDSSYVNTPGFHVSNTIDSLGYPDIVVMELSTMPITSSTQSFSICAGDSLVVGSSVYTFFGNYTDTLSSFYGCDSIIYTNLIVTNNSYSFDTLVASVGVLWNEILLSLSGDYSITLINSVGCDSIVNLNFTYNHISVIDNNNNNNKRTLIKMVDVLGKETNGKINNLLFYIFDDGTVERKIIVE